MNFPLVRTKSAWNFIYTLPFSGVVIDRMSIVDGGMFVEDVIVLVGDVVVSVSLIILVDSVFVGLDMGVVSTWAFEKTLNNFVSYVRKK